MLYDQIRQDMLYLAGRLEHRAAHSRQEREAAEYIQTRLREHCPNVAMEDFHTIESPYFLFALFYGEFVITAIIGIWLPFLAFAYGCGIFIAYLAEFMGYHIFTRFLPPFESQNVVARYYAAKPRKQILVMAHYDSGAASPMTHPNIIGFWRLVHLIILLCMVLILATLAADALNLSLGAEFNLPAIIRWCAATVLGIAAFLLYLNSSYTEDVRGANGNASGVAALLSLAQRFQEEPIENADVWLVCTGSHEIWMAGAQQFFSTHTFDKENTYVLNLECIGSGKLHYLQEEGMLAPNKASAAMLDVLKNLIAQMETETGNQHPTLKMQPPEPAELFSIPTDAHISMARGFQTLTLMGLDETYLPLHWNWTDDTLANIDEHQIANGAKFAETLLRELAKELKY